MREVEKKGVASSLFSTSPLPPYRAGSGSEARPCSEWRNRGAMHNLVLALVLVVVIALTVVANYVAATS